MDSTLSASTFVKTLDTLYERVKRNVLKDLRSVRDECESLGYSGGFLGAQLDLTTVAGEEYITFSVSYVKEGARMLAASRLRHERFPAPTLPTTSDPGSRR